MDASTIRAAQAGDRDAQGAIVDDFTDTVLRSAYGLCGDWDRAADVAQDTFATMLAHLPELREPEAFAGWLMAIVRTSARRHRRLQSPAAPADATAPIPEATAPEDIVIA